jgi:hypothetical protein
MPDLSDEQKVAMARQVAIGLHKMLTGVPDQVKLEASILLTQSLIVALLKPEHRLSVFGTVSKRMRDEIKKVTAEKQR